MILIIHDLLEEEFQKLNIKGDKVLSSDMKITKCMGCFDCWIKNQGYCKYKDNFYNMKDLYNEADKIIVISKNCYGMFSPFIKNVFDRSIGYIKPYFRTYKDEVHHQMHSDKVLKMEYIIYGDMNKLYQNTFDKLLTFNQENFVNDYQVKYVDRIEDLYE
ncbi:MAG: flavodoxin family protein [Bacilli bacterium]|nr:flavodoxin family protein [Bacilli bacterium]